MVDIRPELSEREGRGVDTYIKSPFLSGVPEGALACRIVQVGDAGGCASSDDFAAVEGCSSGIGPRDDSATEGITRSFEKTALAQRVIPYVFMC